MALSEQVQTVLGELRSAIPEIKGALIASSDGLAIAHDVSTGDPNRMAAMVATALGLGRRIAETFGAGTMSETSVAGDTGQVFVYSAGTKGVLAVVAPAQANVGMIHIEARSAAQKIAGILG